MPVPGPDDALRLDGVTAGYGGRPVVEDVTIRVDPGEVVGLVGPNGSGKTTLVRVASRALRPSAGSVRVVGRDPYAISGREAARLVAVVPQDLVPAFAFTSLEIVMMGRAPHRGRGGDDWAKARDAMNATGVQHLADRPVDELSGGERRRVILAQALAQDAPVLLLDEPITHLDLRHVLDLLSLVRRLARREGRAVLAVLHDLNLASSVCDRLTVMDGGRVVATGPPEHVLTRELLASVYQVEAEIERSGPSGRPAVHVGPPLDVILPLGRRAHVIGGAGRGAPLMRMLCERGFDVTAGVLHGGDTDAVVAERLNLARVSVPPFSEIDSESARACRGLIDAADVLVVCDPPFGPGNLQNLRVAVEAARLGARVVVLEQAPIVERDFTGGEATMLWGELTRRATAVADSYEAVLVEAG